MQYNVVNVCCTNQCNGRLKIMINNCVESRNGRIYDVQNKNELYIYLYYKVDRGTLAV